MQRTRPAITASLKVADGRKFQNMRQMENNFSTHISLLAHGYLNSLEKCQNYILRKTLWEKKETFYDKKYAGLEASCFFY